MIFFFLSCFSFLLVYKSISFKPFLPSITIMKLLSSHLWVEQSSSLVSCIRKMRITLGNFGVTFISPLMSKPADLETESKKEMVEEAMSLLDLPELALECILDRLSPAELCSMAGVCTYLKEKCRSDHLWEKHMKQKWGRVIPNTGSRDWQWQIALNQRMRLLGKSKDHGFCRSLSSVWPLSLIFPKLKGRSKGRDFLPPHSTMAWYLSLESGKIWFPAQVYNRENGHDGFMLSCYDAELSYNSETDTFQARYSPHGRLTMEENISWDRLRAPPVDTPQYLLHVSDCLDDLKPGDHFEIQWRRNKEYPYGWWYGVVGHLDSCTGNNCSCYSSDMVVLEFNQYAQESRWRRTIISRKTHHEEGNEGDGFYGGIRKLYGAEEISTWKSMWPNRLLD